ncbi:hypothetical protein [Phormidesmis priestleyi]|uniref:hypothetical protein n=1 Tax=Phormidesmis priestleyi TaxID=268141 RepID=UPI000A9E9C9F|nr:hypothetical protein [Phormidesmis priestleyi]
MSLPETKPLSPEGICHGDRYVKCLHILTHRGVAVRHIVVLIVCVLALLDLAEGCYFMPKGKRRVNVLSCPKTL